VTNLTIIPDYELCFNVESSAFYREDAKPPSFSKVFFATLRLWLLFISHVSNAAVIQIFPKFLPLTKIGNMKILTTCFLLLVTGCLSSAQNFQSLDTIKTYGDYENIYLRKLNSDSLVSSFVIFIKKEVKTYKHVSHSEHVYILDGTGEMTLGDKRFPVKKGDLIFIPKNTFHSLKVTSSIPVKVLSVQAPMFDGKDRIVMEEPK
jgi:mannose-6-phosphate isomerase-like protein (cupin superfamily)